MAQAIESKFALVQIDALGTVEKTVSDITRSTFALAARRSRYTVGKFVALTFGYKKLDNRLIKFSLTFLSITLLLSLFISSLAFLDTGGYSLRAFCKTSSHTSLQRTYYMVRITVGLNR